MANKTIKALISFTYQYPDSGDGEELKIASETATTAFVQSYNTNFAQMRNEIALSYLGGARVGETFKFTLNGTEYILAAKEMSVGTQTMLYFGADISVSEQTLSIDYSEYPFAIAVGGLFTEEAGTYELELYDKVQTVELTLANNSNSQGGICFDYYYYDEEFGGVDAGTTDDLNAGDSVTVQAIWLPPMVEIFNLARLHADDIVNNVECDGVTFDDETYYINMETYHAEASATADVGGIT